ncbi:hypothetical protein L915_08790 [Phytophthora nicotianae]|uniref:Uncharacterized protein n=1 Tax=Phytophthora nicotianae TaxID=4792 RepID=W2GU95_PHYNI|nr:hypothetical protein L915_08790 [Phytophthora nicotianae]
MHTTVTPSPTRRRGKAASQTEERFRHLTKKQGHTGIRERLNMTKNAFTGEQEEDVCHEKNALISLRGPVAKLMPSTKQGLTLKPVSKRHTGSLDILVYEGIIAVCRERPSEYRGVRGGTLTDNRSEWIELDEVLTAAATHGHLNVVKFTVNHAREKNYTPVCAALYEPDALTQAILGQHDEMVEFLPQVAGEIEWDISKAYEAAASTDGKPLAEKLYGIYRYPGESGRAICLLSSHAEGTTKQ